MFGTMAVNSPKEKQLSWEHNEIKSGSNFPQMPPLCQQNKTGESGVTQCSDLLVGLLLQKQGRWHKEGIAVGLWQELGWISELLQSFRFLFWERTILSLNSSVQFSSVAQSVQLFATPWITARQASLSITNSQSLLKLMPIESVMPFSHLIFCRPLLLLPPIPSSIFSNESTLRMKWPKYWSFSFSISPSSEHPGLISFRMDWLDLLAVQGTFKSLLQHHSSKASILWHSAFFTVQLLHPYMITGKTITLTRLTFVDKVMSLLFNMLSRLVITFLPRSKCLLISWLQSPSAVILEPKKIKSKTVSMSPHLFPMRGWDQMPWS